MATLLDLVARGELVKLDPALGGRRQEWRRIYLFPRAETWLRDALPRLGSIWQIELSPLEQTALLIDQFCSGETLLYERQVHPLQHIRDGIWELKTPDVRLFGWFNAKDCFICTDGDDANRVKTMRLYAPYRDQAVRFRNQLTLDEPKFIPGDDPHAVLSACDFA